MMNRTAISRRAKMLRRVHADRRRLSRILIEVDQRKTSGRRIDDTVIEPFHYYGA